MKKLTTEDFIEKSKQVHNNKYNYSLVDYKNSRTKLKINCDIHGIFEQSGNSHLSGQGCPICGKIFAHKKISLNNESFIVKAKKIHGDRYDYSLIKYENNHTKIDIICPKHGIFKQMPNYHLRKLGCPICKTPKGEAKIKIILENNNIDYVLQKKFDDCKYKQPLRFDFYLPNKNLCIEYDGIQHFQSIDRFGGIGSFEETKIKDNIKNEYCLTNNIKLVRIKFDDKTNLEELVLSSI